MSNAGTCVAAIDDVARLLTNFLRALCFAYFHCASTVVLSANIHFGANTIVDLCTFMRTNITPAII